MKKYNWECLCDKPAKIMLFPPMEKIREDKYLCRALKYYPIRFATAWILFLIIGVFAWCLYIITLPFAMMNELVREF